jgi:hypothetical protein
LPSLASKSSAADPGGWHVDEYSEYGVTHIGHMAQGALLTTDPGHAGEPHAEPEGRPDAEAG